MASVTSAFTHALARAVGLTLLPDGRVRSDEATVYRLRLRADGRVEDQSYFEMLGWLMTRQPDRLALVAAYADALEPDQLGVLGFALKTAPTLRDSLVRLERYFQVLTDTAVYSLKESGELATLSLKPLTASHPALVLRNEGALAGVVKTLRRIAGFDIAFEEVSFRHACAGDPRRYAAFFGCPVTFGAREDAIVMSSATLALENRLGDEGLCGFLTGQLEDALDLPREGGLLHDQLMRRIAATLSSGIPQAAAIARDMGMSERTFFRRLAEEGTTFRDVLGEAQMQLARELLEEGDRSIAEIAFMTGFSEQSTFGRAFKRSVGVSPAQYRRTLAGQGHVPGIVRLAGAAQRLAGRADTGRPAIS